mmetsp:Transcript_22712/g.64678  ORF Transcript_22712/g.64678 Transcript_22712/m.64678 type:complete len:635 (-) Transcript_22712:55-1959(-)
MRLRATPWPPRSHAGVRRPAPPLGHDPVDVLRGALDVARLAVDAVLRVDLQPPLSLLLQVLVHTRGAEALLRPVEDGEVARDRHRVILERQVGRLVALVVRAGERYRREEVEGHLAVRLWVLDGRELGGRLEPLVVGAAVRESEPLPASRDVVHDARVQKGAPHAQRRRVRGGTHVAHRVQLLVHPRTLQRRLVRAQVRHRTGEGGGHLLLLLRRLLGLGGLRQRLHRAEGALGRQHARLHRSVRPLDLRHVEEAGGAAHKSAAREGELGDALEAALVQRARAVGQPLPPLEGRPDGRVRLPLLEHLKGVEVGVGVVERDDVPCDDERVSVALGRIEVVQERAAPRVVVCRPSGGVVDVPRPVLLRSDAPQLLESEAVRLRLGARGEAELVDDLLGERAAAALRKERRLCAQLHPSLKRVLWRAVLRHAHVVGRHTDHLVRVVVQDLDAALSGVYLDAELLRLLRQPRGEVAEPHDVVAVVVGRRARHDRQREVEAGEPRGDVAEPLGRHRRLERRAALLPVREELLQRARLKHRARERVLARACRLLEQRDAVVKAGLVAELLEADRGGQARRPATHDQQVRLVRKPLHVDILPPLVGRAVNLLVVGGEDALGQRRRAESARGGEQRRAGAQA